MNPMRLLLITAMASTLALPTACRKGSAPKKERGTVGATEAGWVLESHVAKERKVAKLVRRGLAWAILAEVERGRRRAVVFYPALLQGKLIDNDIAAVVYERDGAGWKRVSRTFGVHRKDGKKTLDEKLGGSGILKVIRPCGLKKSELKGHLKRWGEAFFSRRQAGDDAGAMKAYGQLIRAFSFDFVAHSTVLQGWLALGIAQPGVWARLSEITGDVATLTVAYRGQELPMPFQLGRCGGGWVLDKPTGFVLR